MRNKVVGPIGFKDVIISRFYLSEHASHHHLSIYKSLFLSLLTRIHKIMSGILTVSPASSPFPFGSVAIATYTQKAELVFDESASRVTLDLNGSQITEEDEIVQALAKAGGLSDDSAKVCMPISEHTLWNSGS